MSARPSRAISSRMAGVSVVGGTWSPYHHREPAVRGVAITAAVWRARRYRAHRPPVGATDPLRPVTRVFPISPCPDLPMHVPGGYRRPAGDPDPRMYPRSGHSRNRGRPHRREHPRGGHWHKRGLSRRRPVRAPGDDRDHRAISAPIAPAWRVDAEVQAGPGDWRDAGPTGARGGAYQGATRAAVTSPKRVPSPDPWVPPASASPPGRGSRDLPCSGRSSPGR